MPSWTAACRTWTLVHSRRPAVTTGRGSILSRLIRSWSDDSVTPSVCRTAPVESLCIVHLQGAAPTTIVGSPLGDWHRLRPSPQDASGNVNSRQVRRPASLVATYHERLAAVQGGTCGPADAL